MPTSARTAVNSNRTPANIDAFPSIGDLNERVARLIDLERPRFRRLWLYFRNPIFVAACSASSDSNSTSARPYRQAQEWGLPARITGLRMGADPLTPSHDFNPASRKEIVIENDIGWRVEAMVDYLFGKPLVITSSAPDPARRETISELLRLILAHNGGILFLQQLALLGSVYGFVDVLVKLEDDCFDEPTDDVTTHATDVTPAASTGMQCGIEQLGQPPACNHDPSPDGAGPSTGSSPRDPETARVGEDLPQAVPASGEGAASGAHASESNPGASHPSQKMSHARISATQVVDVTSLARLARRIRLEVVEPARALPFLSSFDYRVFDAYAQCFDVTRAKCDSATDEASSPATWFERLLHHTSSALSRFAADRRSALHPESNGSSSRILEIITDTHWRRYENGAIVSEGRNSLGEIPLVHIQNTAVPFAYAGASDVEPLMPLQDELNTRLSDRAHRITMQSFRMYLGKGIEDFNSLPVSPGRMWMSDNDHAEVIEFGGDAACPSEDAHIADLREAMDKASGVSPIAAGAIKGRIGRLTSAAALRVTMQSLLARTDKKRTTYGTGIARMCELALAWLDRAGLFQTRLDERRIELSWPSPLPENELEKLQEAETKLRLGVAREIVLRELGY